MTIKPLGDRILVEIITEQDITPSGIVLPDTVDKQKKAEGIVKALGNGEKVSALGLKEGDKVIFGKYAGDEVEQDKKEYKILNHDDVLAVYSA